MKGYTPEEMVELNVIEERNKAAGWDFDPEDYIDSVREMIRSSK